MVLTVNGREIPGTIEDVHFTETDGAVNVEAQFVGHHTASMTMPSVQLKEFFDKLNSAMRHEELMEEIVASSAGAVCAIVRWVHEPP